MERWSVRPLVFGMAASIGTAAACAFPWATWPGAPGVSPTLSVSGLALSRGALVFSLAVLTAVAFVVSAGTKSRLPLVFGTLAGAVSVDLSATILRGVGVAVANVTNGESPLQAQVGTGAVLALVFAVATTIIAGVGSLAGVQERETAPASEAE